MKKKQLKVRYAKHGLANFFGEYIEINENLKYNKRLRDYVVKHELRHSSDFDLGYEIAEGIKLFNNLSLTFSLIAFYLKNPTTWIDLLPIQIRNRKIIYDLNLIIFYVFIILGIVSLKFFL